MKLYANNDRMTTMSVEELVLATYKFNIPVSLHLELKVNTQEILNFIEHRDV
jgi:hypothetical protein